MKINKQALEAIRKSAISGENLANLFEKMASGIEAVGSPGGLLILSFIDPTSMPEEGELIPTITAALKPFTLRPSTPKEEGQIAMAPDSSAPSLTSLNNSGIGVKVDTMKILRKTSPENQNE